MLALFSRQSSARHPRRVTSRCCFAAEARARPALPPAQAVRPSTVLPLPRHPSRGLIWPVPRQAPAKAGQRGARHPVIRNGAGVNPCRIGAAQRLAVLKSGARAKPKPAGASPGAGRAVCLTDGHIIPTLQSKATKKTDKLKKKQKKKPRHPGPCFLSGRSHRARLGPRPKIYQFPKPLILLHPFTTP